MRSSMSTSLAREALAKHDRETQREKHHRSKHSDDERDVDRHSRSSSISSLSQALPVITHVKTSARASSKHKHQKSEQAKPRTKRRDDSDDEEEKEQIAIESRPLSRAHNSKSKHDRSVIEAKSLAADGTITDEDFSVEWNEQRGRVIMPQPVHHDKNHGAEVLYIPHDEDNSCSQSPQPLPKHRGSNQFSASGITINLGASFDDEQRSNEARRSSKHTHRSESNHRPQKPSQATSTKQAIANPAHSIYKDGDLSERGDHHQRRSTHPVTPANRNQQLSCSHSTPAHRHNDDENHRSHAKPSLLSPLSAHRRAASPQHHYRSQSASPAHRYKQSPFEHAEHESHHHHHHYSHLHDGRPLSPNNHSSHHHHTHSLNSHTSHYHRTHSSHAKHQSAMKSMEREAHAALKCPRCSHHFKSLDNHSFTQSNSHHSRVPRLLSCGHTLCTTCVCDVYTEQARLSDDSHDDSKRWLQCPYSCAPTLLTNSSSLHDLPVNQPLLSLIHNASNDNHWTSVTNSHQVHFCSTHSKHPLSLYCHDCVALICVACTSPLFAHTLGSIPSAVTSHVDHRTSRIEEIYQLYQNSSIDDKVKSLYQSEIELLTKDISTLGQQLLESQSSHQHLLMTVKQRFAIARESIAALIDQHESSMVQSLNDYYRKQSSIIESNRRILVSEANELTLAKVEHEIKESHYHHHQHIHVSTSASTEDRQMFEMQWYCVMQSMIKREKKERKSLIQSKSLSLSQSIKQHEPIVALDDKALIQQVALTLQRTSVIQTVPLTAEIVSVEQVSPLSAKIEWRGSEAEGVSEWQLEVHSTDRSKVFSARDDGERIGLANLIDERPSTATTDNKNRSTLSSTASVYHPHSTKKWQRIYTGKQTTYTMTIEADRVYDVRLRAINAIGVGDWVYFTDTVLPTVSSYQFHYVGDHSGIFHSLGLIENTYHYTNPALSDLVRVSLSSRHPHSHEPHTLFSRSAAATFVATLSLPHSFITVDVSPTTTNIGSVILTVFTVTHPVVSEWRKRRMRRWRMLASEDDRHYQELGEWNNHGDCDGGDGVTVKCAIDSTVSRNSGRGYRYFRLQQMGVNGDGDHALCVAGLELYGLAVSNGCNFTQPSAE